MSKHGAEKDAGVEWGVLWDETGEVEPTETRMAAERIVALHSWDGYVVSRTVTYGEWAEA